MWITFFREIGFREDDYPLPFYRYKMHFINYNLWGFTLKEEEKNYQTSHGAKSGKYQGDLF